MKGKFQGESQKDKMEYHLSAFRLMSVIGNVIWNNEQPGYLSRKHNYVLSAICLSDIQCCCCGDVKYWHDVFNIYTYMCIYIAIHIFVCCCWEGGCMYIVTFVQRATFFFFFFFGGGGGGGGGGGAVGHKDGDDKIKDLKSKDLAWWYHISLPTINSRKQPKLIN